MRLLVLRQYTGRLFTAPADVDIDHLVPLKEVHESGGHAFTEAEKETYANDRVDPQHEAEETAVSRGLEVCGLYRIRDHLDGRHDPEP